MIGEPALSPPADDEAERNLLGGILLRPNLAHVMVATLCRDDFRTDAHQRVFEAISRLDYQDVTPDMSLVRGLLQDTGGIDAVGLAYLYSLVDGLPVADEAAMLRLCSRIRAVSRARRLYYAAGVLQAEVARHPHELAEQLEAFRLRVDKEASISVAPVVDDATLLEQPDIEELVKDRLVAESFACLVGPPGVGKTFTAIDLALSIATGFDWLSAKVKKRGPVLAVVGEGQRGWKSRVRAWKADRGLPLDRAVGLHVWSGAVNFMDSADVQRFVHTVRAVRPALVVLDTLARCMIAHSTHRDQPVHAIMIACSAAS